jgi:plastocyanin
MRRPALTGAQGPGVGPRLVRRRGLRGIAPTVFALSAAVVAAACGVGEASLPSPTTGTLTPSGSVRTLEVATALGDVLAFDPPSLTAPAEAPVVVAFRNPSAEPHNLTFIGPIETGTRTIVEPGGTDTVAFTTPAAGRYTFVCSIHQGMTGELVVEAGSGG